MTLLTALGSRLRVLTSSLSSLCAAPWRTGAAVIAWHLRRSSVRTIPFRVFRPCRILCVGNFLDHHHVSIRIGSMMSDRPASRDVETTSREIGPGVEAPRLREPGSIPNRGPLRCEETGVSEVFSTQARRLPTPDTARRTHNCVRRCPGVVASCSVTSPPPVITRPGRTRRSRSSHASRDGPS